nr:extracellular solute-binding protein [uncultured Sphaerochaeta sp.]
MKNRKFIVVLLVLVSLVLSMGFAKGAQEKEGLNIHYITARGENEGTVQALKDTMAAYKELHPNFNFEIESIPARSEYLQKIRILAASNELPEWFDSDPEDFFASLVDADLVYNIGDLFRELGVFDDVYRISRDYLMLPGSDELFLIGMQANAEYIFYNKEMFRKAGITTVPRTFDDFVQACVALDRAGFTPITTSSREWPSLRYFAMLPFRMTGNKYIMDAVTGQGSWGVPEGILAAEFMQKISPYFQKGFATASYDDMLDLFLGNKAAMLYMGTWELANLTDSEGNIKAEYGYFPMPIYSENDATPPTDFFSHSGIGIAINKNSMNDQMKDFIRFFFKTYPDICVEKYNFIPSINPTENAVIPPLLSTLLKDIEGVKEYAYCWDVVIDQASLETLHKSNTELLLGLITPQEWARTMDTIVAENM